MDPLSLRQKARAFFFGLPRFATMFVATSLVTLTLPLFVVETMGDQSKGKHLGLITAAAALLSVGVLYAFGRFRDREHRIMQGPRYPLYGLMLMLPGLIFLAAGRRYPLLIGAFFIIIVSRSFCEASHLAVLADRPPVGGRQRFTAGIAFWHFLGTGLGALSFGFLPKTAWIRGGGLTSNPAALAALLVALSMAGYYYFYAVPQRHVSLPSHDPERPMRFKLPGNLVHLIGARIFFVCGILIISTFLLYIVRDLLAAQNVQRTTALLYGGSIIGGVLAALPAGKLTERHGERYVLFLSGSILALTAILFFTLGRFHSVLTMICMIVYGAGFALTFSAGLSLTVKLIPHPRMAGRIMAIITASTFFSQFLASLSGAAVLDPLNRVGHNLGYFALLVLIEVDFIVGGLFLLKIRDGD